MDHLNQSNESFTLNRTFTDDELHKAHILCKGYANAKCSDCPLVDIPFCTETLRSFRTRTSKFDIPSFEGDCPESSESYACKADYFELSPTEKLNFFRNKYYNDGNTTENGIIADAINTILPRMVVPPCMPGEKVWFIKMRPDEGKFNKPCIVCETVSSICMSGDHKWICSVPSGSFHENNLDSEVFRDCHDAEIALEKIHNMMGDIAYDEE